jgi:cation:H+ antiporter
MLLALMLIGGLVILTLGAESLVRGSVAVASRLNISPLMIGLTLVGFGTSTPELVASLHAAWAGSPGIAIGNVVGSNIFNILVILGLTAVIHSVHVARGTWQRDGLFMLVVTLLAMLSFTLLSGQGQPLPRWLGTLAVALLVGYLAYVYIQERTQKHTLDPDLANASKLHPGVAIGMVVGGLVGLVLGANLLVDAAIQLARNLGISETVIGLTIVAIGTSLPELATSVVAAVRKQADIAIGNILGSNIFNILGILGVTAMLSPIPVDPQIIRLDMWVMLGAAVALLLYSRVNWQLGRAEGLLFLLAYGLYTLFLLG